MRRYLQGTLDFACGIYAVVNALSCLYGLELTTARRLFQETLIALASVPDVWTAFVRNNTDHYWLVRYMLQRWCLEPPLRTTLVQPFSSCLLPGQDEFDLARTSLYLPEREEPGGPASLLAAMLEAREVWAEIATWLDPPVPTKKRAAVLRFHRFLPGVAMPVVSHWTTACRVEAEILHLHDASSEKNALFTLERFALQPGIRERALVRIVPESLLLLEASCIL